MSTKKLPAQFDPFYICRNAPKEGTHWEGAVSMDELKNLDKDISSKDNQPISVDLTFSQDEEGICCIEGSISVELNYTCQRCMKPMTHLIDSSFKVSPVIGDEQAKHLPARYEPLLAENGEVSLADWIAEELLLALPLVPRHEPPCLSYDDNTKVQTETPKKVSPFAALKKKDST